jgi:hypothetical protein
MITKNLCLDDEDSDSEDEEFEEITVLYNIYRSLAYCNRIPRSRSACRPRSIDSFSESECWIRFHILKSDLYRVLTCFNLSRFTEDTPIRLDNHMKFTGEELLMFSLERFSYPRKLFSFIDTYGRDWSAWSRAFKWFCLYIIGHYAWLIRDNFDYWKKYFPSFAEAISAKITEKSDGGIIFPGKSYRVAMFHDCTVTITCRPGGGPAEDGINAARFNGLLQQSFYNGWKHTHGVKYLSVEAPNGMCIDLYGPDSFRASDLDLMHASDLNLRLRVAQEDQPDDQQYKSYGDGIFPMLTHCIGKCFLQPL